MPSPTKRSSLETLKRPRLIEVAETFVVEVSSRAKYAEFVDPLMSAWSPKLDALLPTQSRDQLKAIRDAHNLDRSWRGKAPIVAPIYRSKPNAAAPGGAESPAPISSCRGKCYAA